jgi:hypothetical protein
MSIDVKDLADDITRAASDVIETDVRMIRTFSERQVEALAQQAAFVAEGIVSGTITDSTSEFFLDELEHMAESFAKTLVRMNSVLIEKVWNAVVGVIWQAIERAAGIALPLPMLA